MASKSLFYAFTGKGHPSVDIQWYYTLYYLYLKQIFIKLFRLNMSDIYYDL
jgi:hypothetical protein